VHHRNVPRDPILTTAERGFLADAREAVLATLDPDGLPRLVPICFVVAEDNDRLDRPRLYTPIDEKPKASADPRQLARMRDLLVLPTAVVLVDRWDEDWSRLAWLRVYARAEILEPQPHEIAEHAAAVKALRAKYRQYETQNLDARPIIRLTIDRARSWGAIEGQPSS
jgi:PPOX class probable F420-dependent enzyme